MSKSSKRPVIARQTDDQSLDREKQFPRRSRERSISTRGQTRRFDERSSRRRKSSRSTCRKSIVSVKMTLAESETIVHHQAVTIATAIKTAPMVIVEDSRRPDRPGRKGDSSPDDEDESDRSDDRCSSGDDDGVGTSTTSARHSRIKLHKLYGTGSWESWWAHFKNCATYNR